MRQVDDQVADGFADVEQAGDHLTNHIHRGGRDVNGEVGQRGGDATDRGGDLPDELEALRLDLIEDAGEAATEVAQRADHGIQHMRRVGDGRHQNFADRLPEGDQALHHAFDKRNAELDGFGENVRDLLADFDQGLNELLDHVKGLLGQPGEQFHEPAADIAQRLEHRADGIDGKAGGGFQHFEDGFADRFDAFDHLLERLEAGAQRAFDEVGDGFTRGQRGLHQVGHLVDGPVNDVFDDRGNGADDVAHGARDRIHHRLYRIYHGIRRVLDEGDDGFIVGRVRGRDDRAFAADHLAGVGQPPPDLRGRTGIEFSAGVQDEVLHQSPPVRGRQQADGMDDTPRLAGRPQTVKGKTAVRWPGASDDVEHAA